ncbi:MAG: RNA polymerase factor sigma-32, partial [Rhodospirillaceae bacterium]|nr:RNA polymerase factor sigma-32 [Rhodospirillaceae bacterium]
MMGSFEETMRRRNLLNGAMIGLTDRERTILTERRLKSSPSTLENLSQSFGISRERVRQIEERAFVKVQKSVKNTVIELSIAS